jgi:hypothetical protein
LPAHVQQPGRDQVPAYDQVPGRRLPPPSYSFAEDQVLAVSTSDLNLDTNL